MQSISDVSNRPSWHLELETLLRVDLHADRKSVV